MKALGIVVAAILSLVLMACCIGSLGCHSGGETDPNREPLQPDLGELGLLTWMPNPNATAVWGNLTGTLTDQTDVVFTCPKCEHSFTNVLVIPLNSRE